VHVVSTSVKFCANDVFCAWKIRIDVSPSVKWVPVSVLKTQMSRYRTDRLTKDI